MVYLMSFLDLGADMTEEEKKELILFIERKNVFAAFLRSLKKGYVLNKELARVEVGKLYMNLN